MGRDADYGEGFPPPPPGPPLVPPAIPDPVPDPMERGRNQDNEREAEDRIAGPVAQEPPVPLEQQQEEERPEKEVVLGAAGSPFTARLSEAALHERARAVPEERADGEDH